MPTLSENVSLHILFQNVVILINFYFFAFLMLIIFLKRDISCIIRNRRMDLLIAILVQKQKELSLSFY